MNPLDQVGQVFSLSMMNPNPKARRRRDGPRYFLEVEIDRDAFDQFMAARELAGMVIEAHATVTALNEPLDTREGGVGAPGAVREKGVGATTGLVPTEPRTPGTESLAYRLHRDGYFRNPILWNLLHQRAIYTVPEHKRFIESLPCFFAILRDPAASGSMLSAFKVNVTGLRASLGMELACKGDVCLHHVNSAAITAGGREQPEAPRKVLHFYGLPLCYEHHANWAHSKYATRKEKDGLLEVAVALTADQIKERIKAYVGIESLRELTQEQLDSFEQEIGLK